MYECCERLAGAEAEALLAQLRAAPEVPVAPHADGPVVMDASAGRSSARATMRPCWMNGARVDRAEEARVFDLTGRRG